MSSQRNCYEVLGVPETATTDQIKKKYRELARKFHPDVVKDKDLGQRVFSQINQAYRILNDTERRAEYDASVLAAAQTKAAQSQNGTAAQNGSATKNGASHQNGAAYQNGTAHQNGAAAQARAAEGQAGSAQKMQAVGGLLGNADNAIMAGKPVEARAFCMKVLEIDPSNVRALEILGDALVSMGQREEAAAQYRKAIQIAPSHSIQAKLNRIEQGVSAVRATAASQADRPSFDRTPGPAKASAPAKGRPETAPAKETAATRADPIAAGVGKANGLLDRLLKRK